MVLAAAHAPEGAFARPEYPANVTDSRASIDAAHYPFLAGSTAIDEGLA